MHLNNICIVTRNMSNGGAERVLSQLIAYFTKQNIHVSLILLTSSPIHYRIPESCEIVVIGKKASSALKDKILCYGEIRRHICKRKPQIVLSMPEEVGVYVIAAMLGTGIPVVVSERNNPWVMPDKKVTRLLRRLMYPFVNGLIFQTERAASFFPASQRKKGIVLPNPLDVSRLPEVYRGEREKTVVSAGRLANQKNFPLLIEAFSKFYETHRDYQLVIYGEGSKRQELEALAAEKLPEGAWSMPGRVDDLPERIGRCGIFALSSDYEGVPNVLIEALAVGTPAVTTDCVPGGAAELIQNGKNGLIVPVKDVGALAEGLSYMADHPTEASAMAAEGVKIRERLDAEKVTADWLDYLSSKCNAEKDSL